MMTGPHKIHQNLAQTMVWAPGLEVKVDKSKFIKYMHNTAQVRDWLPYNDDNRCLLGVW